MIEKDKLYCFQIKNGYLNSCTYILYKKEYKSVWLVDCGDYNQINNWLKENDKVPVGIFFTHCHLDHIYGVNKLTSDYPSVLIYISNSNGKIGLRDCRLNTSKYTPEPYVVESNLINELSDNETILIFEDTEVEALMTDGHSPDSMSYIVGEWIFTGDAYIPTCNVITRLPGGNKEKAARSVERIIQMVDDEKLIIMPGHHIEKEETR